MARPETRRLEVARAVRAFADGFASVLLARYLQDLGFDAFWPVEHPWQRFAREVLPELHTWE